MVHFNMKALNLHSRVGENLIIFIYPLLGTSHPAIFLKKEKACHFLCISIIQMNIWKLISGVSKMPYDRSKITYVKCIYIKIALL